MTFLIHRDRLTLGAAAANQAGKGLVQAIARQGSATLVVATGASQFEVLAALAAYPGIEWPQVDIFHLDEYIGIPATHPASFRHYLRKRLITQLPQSPRAFHEIAGEGDPQAECQRLAQLVPSGEFDVAMIGIGENGHLAFNDPPADFTTEAPYLNVRLDEACRRQQVDEGWYASLAAVPENAITMSVSRIMASRLIVCSVPEQRKAFAVRAAIEGALTPEVPASILRLHSNTHLHLDRASASLLYRWRGDCSPEQPAEPDSKTCPLDMQLNGYRGIDFNADNLTVEEVRNTCERLRQDGGGQFLGTIITDSMAKMTARIARLAAAFENDPVVRQTMVGIHIEGPFISPEVGYCGAHPAEHTLSATQEAAGRLLDAGGGLVRMVTLAPEHDAGLRTTRWLSDRNVLVSAGHCNPSRDLLSRAVDAGLSLFTHLGNGCPALLPRHDNIIQRVLACGTLPFIMFIADGVHIPLEVLGNYLTLAGIARSIVVTDGTSAAGMGPGRFLLAGQEVTVGEDGAAWAEGRSHLVGSTATMPQLQSLLQSKLNLPEGDVERLVGINPRRAARCG